MTWNPMSQQFDRQIDSWESRMAQRAAERERAAAEATPKNVRDESDPPWWPAGTDRAVNYLAELAPMTVGEARAYLDREHYACACRGGPDCCVTVYEYARRLVNAENPPQPS